MKAYPELPKRKSAHTVNDVFTYLIHSKDVQRMAWHTSLDQWRTAENQQDAIAEMASALAIRFNGQDEKLLELFNSDFFPIWLTKAFSNQLKSSDSPFATKYRSNRGRKEHIALEDMTRGQEPSCDALPFDFSASTAHRIDASDRALLRHLLRSDLAIEAKISPEQVDIYERGFLFLARECPKERPSIARVASHLGISIGVTRGAITRIHRFLKAHLAR